MPYVIGVDIGGTCTDSVVVDENGAITLAKVFSTPADFSQGILDSLAAAAEQLNVHIADLLRHTVLFLHSTTVAENAIVDGTLAKGALLVSRGFENTLYMTRGGYGRWSGLTEMERKDAVKTDKPAVLVPQWMIKGIRERTDAQGTVLFSPDVAEIEAAVRELLADKADAMGVCFLWSFRNPENELAVRRVVERLAPNVFFTMSSDLAPIEGEYERMSTVALNACLGPTVARYLGNLQRRLHEQGLRSAMLVMQAHGGLLPLAEAPARAVGLIESGPVGGLIGSKAIADLQGLGNILFTDMGGTTFKAGTITDGRIDYEREPRVVRYHYALHKMEMVSIGVAGGSIISVDSNTGLPSVGPRSAGAYPGPVCYGFGGDEPTVTDIDIILGYLDQRFFLSGRGRLDRDKALQVFRDKVANPLKMDLHEAARSVYRLVNALIFDLLHKQTVEKGLDPRDYSLFVAGGTGGMHLGTIAPELGVRRIVVPYSASVQGAFGLVSADVERTDMISETLRVPVDPVRFNEIFARLTKRVTDRLVAAGFAREDIITKRAVNMRYRRQVHVLSTPVDGDAALDPSDLEQICQRFEAIYADRYGKEAGYRDAGMEVVSFLVRGIAELRKPRLKPSDLSSADPSAAAVEKRMAYFGATNKQHEALCYDFEKLRPGNVVEGPAILWTPITTIVVNPGHKAECDAYRNIVMSW